MPGPAHASRADFSPSCLTVACEARARPPAPVHPAIHPAVPSLAFSTLPGCWVGAVPQAGSAARRAHLPPLSGCAMNPTALEEEGQRRPAAGDGERSPTPYPTKPLRAGVLCCGASLGGPWPSGPQPRPERRASQDPAAKGTDRVRVGSRMNATLGIDGVPSRVGTWAPTGNATVS